MTTSDGGVFIGNLSRTIVNNYDSNSAAAYLIGDTSGNVYTNILSEKSSGGNSIILEDFSTNDILVLDTVGASAVNSITITNAATGNAPAITSTGSDSNIDLTITPKASGKIVLDGLSWPNADSTSNFALTTNGTGTLSFGRVYNVIEVTLTTTNATPTTLGSLATASNTTYYLDCALTARRTDAGTESAGYRYIAIYRNNSGTLTKIGESKTAIETTAAWDVTSFVSGTNIVFQVTGEAAKNIDWKGNHRFITV